jgi:HEAT repeat protein
MAMRLVKLRKFSIIIFVLLAIGALTPHQASALGPYTGVILDRLTGEPIEGASVLVYWTKQVPEYIHSVIIHSHSETIAVRLVYTDRDGRYNIPSVFYSSSSDRLDSTNVIIYQPGYKAYLNEILHAPGAGPPKHPDFKDMGNTVKLDRLPPCFDHRAHVEMIDHAMYWYYTTPTMLGIVERVEFMQRVNWERRRGFKMGLLLPSFGFANESRRIFPKWMELLRNGSSAEKILALGNSYKLKYSEYTKDPRVWDPVLSALLDQDPIVRVAAAAFLQTIGQTRKEDMDSGVFSSGCCKETAIVPSLITALDDRDPRVRAEAAAALGWYYGDRKSRTDVDREDRAIDPLINSLKDPDPWVRLNATFALGNLDATKAIAPLTELLHDGSDRRSRYVRQEAVWAIKRLRHVRESRPETVPIPVVGHRSEEFIEIKKRQDAHQKEIAERPDYYFPLLLSQLKDRDPAVRNNALDDLWTLRDHHAVKDRLLGMLKDKDPSVRDKAVYLLGQLKENDLAGPLLTMLEDDNETVRLRALQALGSLNDARIPDANIRMLHDPAFYVRTTAIGNVRRTRDRRAVESLIGFFHTIERFNNDDDFIATLSIGALGTIGDVRAVDPLIDTLDGQFEIECSPSLRIAAAEALGTLKDKKALPDLSKVLLDNDEIPSLRSAVAQAIGAIGDLSSLGVLKKAQESSQIGDYLSHTPNTQQDIQKFKLETQRAIEKLSEK